jgi:phospholipid/cholesterol/gamma-HCH transport system substrate-binding protein
MPEPMDEHQAAATPRADSAEVGRGVQIRALLLLALMAFVLVVTALYLMWARGAFEATQPLYLTTDDSDGVSVGMDLTFSGFPIGRVRSIALSDGGTVRIRVDLVRKDAHWLRNSSVFTLERGLVGAARLRAFTGVPDAPPLPVGAVRPVLRGDVSAEIPRMVADAREVLQNVARLTAADSALSGTLTEIDQFSARLNGERGGLLTTLTGREADARRVGELLDHVDSLVTNLNRTVIRADGQLLGKKGLVADTQASVRQINALLADTRKSLVQVDAVLKNTQAISGNVRDATTDLSALRAQVETNLNKIDGMIGAINQKWPFAPKEKEVTLP